MGCDGTLGCKAVKAAAGLVLVQSPETASYDNMPRSVINQNLSDIVAHPNVLARNILSYLENHNSIQSLRGTPAGDVEFQKMLEKITYLLQKKTGNDFSLYKKNTILRRIERRMGIHKMASISAYAQYLENNPTELDLLFKEMLIGVTSFFRDPKVWDQLQASVLQELLLKAEHGKCFRAWVPACSTGEEAYSLAISFREAIDISKHDCKHYSLQIFATDIDSDAIAVARQGRYKKENMENISPELIEKYFIEDELGYQPRKEIRELIIFAEQNIIIDPPFTKLDLICCRNLLIYFDSALQNRLINIFNYALLEGGLLILGNAETIGENTHLFCESKEIDHIFHRKETSFSIVNLDFPTRSPIMPLANENHIPKDLPMNDTNFSLEAIADEFLLRRFSPVAVLINSNGDILYINGRSNKYLEPAAGKANWNIYAMINDSLRHDVGVAITEAKEGGNIVKTTCEMHSQDDTVQIVDILVQMIASPRELAGLLMIVFTEGAYHEADKIRSPATVEKKLLDELDQAKMIIQKIREEKQTSQEELKATNEELQSTNEELTTSKEEMQSLNEELQTVNSELQSKIDDLSWVHNDMINLLNSTEIATLFLDSKLNIRRFSSFCTPIFKLIASDVGRPISDIMTELDYPDLLEDAAKVLKNLVFSEKQVATQAGHWYKVRIMPYRTQENVIDGVVITLIDIDSLVKNRS